MSEATRDPQSVKNTIATTVSLGTLVGGLLQIFAPDTDPFVVTFISQTICGGLVHLLGSVTRDRVHFNSELDPPVPATFWQTQFSKLG